MFLEKKDAPATEFDLVINRDYLDDPEIVSDIIEFAFHKKIGKEFSRDKRKTS